ncbi:hypothetical protein ACMFMF_008049 [Clarireedia jacksonii]
MYLDYNSSTAWEQIYGFAKNGKGNFRKDLRDRVLKEDHLNMTNSSPKTRITAGPEDHRRFRRLQSHAFSEKSLAAQEPLMQDYTKQFVDGLIKFSSKSTDHSINLGRWFNFATFDIIGDLAFGEPFGCLKTGIMHPWIEVLLTMFKVVTYITEAGKFPPIGPFLVRCVPEDIRYKLEHHIELAREKAERRMATETDRPDFMSYILRYNDEDNGMTPEEIKENANVLIGAGSETTASLLNGVTYFLLQNPTILHNLTVELRSTFKSPTELTLQSLASCKYLNAVLEEGLRMYPPVATTLPRFSPPGGATIEGKYVPGGVTVGVNHWSANYSASNFSEPYTFHPERWLNAEHVSELKQKFPEMAQELLSPERFANDDRKARQPFSYGPANCIGKNLAYGEMRLLLGSLVWGFDMEGGEGADTWLARNETYGLWLKPELNVKLTRVNV